jgi:hypothetical protein
MAGEPSFSIPARPKREFPRRGGVEYRGQTIFRLVPAHPISNERLADLLEGTLCDGPYRYGDFLNLPMPLYLVRDDGTGDVFRVSIRDGRIRLHVLPETEPAGLQRLYDRLVDRSTADWHVECETSA